MPLYEFECRRCGPFPLLRSMASRDQAAACPACGAPSSRVITAPNLSLMAPGQRLAHSRNERSQHEPGLLNRHRCGSGCGCGPSKGKTAGGSKPKRTIQVPKLGRFETGRRGRRPWMLGH